MPHFGDPVRNVVGAKTAEGLADLGIETAGDLLRHYPRRYAERGELTQLNELALGEHVTVLAHVKRAHTRRMKNRPGTICEVIVTDGTGDLRLTFFGKKNQQWRERDLYPGRYGLFAGKVEEFKAKRQLTHPDYHLFDDDPESQKVADYAGALIPVYPATKDLPSWNITRAVRLALDTVDLDEDPLPEKLRKAHRLLDQASAYTSVHRPDTRREVDQAHRRLKWDEAFALQVALAQRRAAARATPAKPRPLRPGGLLEAFDARLPFTLTSGQVDVSGLILDEIAEAHPMHRLLHGEVGSGKTVVALRAMLAVVDAGGQAALLAPTEVLAAQHARSIGELLGPLALAGQLGSADVATRVVLLTGSLSAAARRAALDDVASGGAGIVVGTHALLEGDVAFADLGLVVVDEQHRFGVEQREALRAKGAEPPHVLVMTATPIPRTVAMTVYGDLEVSTLTELPAGRTMVRTHVVPAREKPEWLDAAWTRIREHVDAGHQAFVVCPRIGGDDDAGDADAADAAEDAEDANDADDEGIAQSRRSAAAVLDWQPELAAGPLAGLRVEMMHGRMHTDDKDAVMRRFAGGEIDVLVSTTVIEVGVDVPNATVMVVLDADRFGVSQLHQLRGRIGRGGDPGLCLLVTDSAPDTPARARLDAVAATHDGFELSQLDLEQRREGDVLDKVQAGRRSSLRLLSVLRDEDLIRTAREDASALVAADPDLGAHDALRRVVEEMVGADRATFLEKA